MEVDRVVFLGCVFAFTAAAVVSDLRTRRLPNWLTVSAFFAALVYGAIRGWVSSGLGGAAAGLLFAVAGFATGFGIVFVLWLIGGGAEAT